MKKPPAKSLRARRDPAAGARLQAAMEQTVAARGADRHLMVPAPKISRTFHRFKVQRLVNLRGAAKPGQTRSTTIGAMWRTVAEADAVTVGEMILRGLRTDAETKHETYRLAEQWPPNTEPKTVL